MRETLKIAKCLWSVPAGQGTGRPCLWGIHLDPNLRSTLGDPLGSRVHLDPNLRVGGPSGPWKEKDSKKVEGVGSGLSAPRGWHRRGRKKIPGVGDRAGRGPAGYTGVGKEAPGVKEKGQSYPGGKGPPTGSQQAV